MTDQSEMEALLRAKHPDYSDEHIRDLLSATISHRHAHDAAQNWRILAHLRAEKAKARKEGFHAGREDMAKEGWPICELAEAEAAALERAKQIVAKHEDHKDQKYVCLAAISNELDALISPTSRTALSERDERTVNETLEFAARVADNHGAHTAAREIRDAKGNHPAQGAKEQP